MSAKELFLYTMIYL